MPLTKRTKSEEKGLRCIDPEHHIPMGTFLEPGEYTWECPKCGAKKEFIVNAVTC